MEKEILELVFSLALGLRGENSFLFEQGIHELFWFKGQQVAHLFADANESHRQFQLSRDGYDYATFRSAVELGEYDAGDARRLGEQARLLQAVLTSGRVHNQ